MWGEYCEIDDGVGFIFGLMRRSKVGYIGIDMEGRDSILKK